MKIWLLCLLLCWASLLSAQTYRVGKVAPGAVRAGDLGSAPAWRKATILKDFVYPWDSAAAPGTSFSAVWDGEWLYGLYKVQDDSVITLVKKNDKMEVGASDRVEIFLARNDSMNPYYCLEMDADGRVLDYNATYYRKMNYPWTWPEGQLVIKASRVSDGYILAFAISIQSLKDLGLLQNGRLHAGLFRAECKGMVNGRADLRWISWIRPASVQPDFHIPSALGILVLDPK